MMKIVVTGSEGFIGKALCKNLRSRGVEVVGIDRVCGTEAAGVPCLLAGGGIDAVIHLAAQTSVFNSDHEKILRDNIDSFVAMYALRCETGVCKFFHRKSMQHDKYVRCKQTF